LWAAVIVWSGVSFGDGSGGCLILCVKLLGSAIVVLMGKELTEAILDTRGILYDTSSVDQYSSS